jgi:hypothetical protein
LEAVERYGQVYSLLFAVLQKVQSVLEVFMSGDDIILYSKRKCKDDLLAV